MTDVIGLDVSQGHSYATWYRGEKCQEEFEFMHTISGFEKLRKLVNKSVNPQVVFEATGVYSRPVKKFCTDNQIPFCELNPLDLKLKMSGLRRIKTDVSDSHRIALTALVNDFRTTQPKAKIYVELQELSRFIDRIQNDVNLKHTQLHSQLQQTFPEIEVLFSSRVSKLALNVISLFPHPDLVRELSRTKLKNRLMNSTDKRLSKAKGLKYAEQLLELAKDSYPAVEADSIQVQSVSYYCQALTELIIQKEKLVKQLIKTAQQLEEYEIIISMPGIGEQSAAQLIGELGDVRRFNKANQINAYVGIDINRYQSGKYQRQDHINRRGNPKARTILYLIVLNMIRAQHWEHNHIVDYYYKLKNGPIPKRNKVAIVACMNKTVHCLFSMIQANQRYEYTYHELKAQ